MLESLGGQVGGQVAKAIDNALSLSGRATYFLAGHGEADAHHSEDLRRVIGTHLTKPGDQEPFLRMARESQELYCEILDHAFAARALNAQSALDSASALNYS